MNKTIFVCAKCDAQASKWSGRCAECGEWGSLKEQAAGTDQSLGKRLDKLTSASRRNTGVAAAAVVDFSTAKNSFFAKPKIKTGLAYFDKVLAGGIAPGSLILLGGDPGVGKSTLALQLACLFRDKIMYASAEESASQVSWRFARLSGERASNLLFINEDNLETIIATITQQQPQLAIIDSLQTVFSAAVKTSAGSPNQIKAVTAKLAEAAKAYNIALLLIGHVTKEGDLDGPKTLEHLVDAVLYLEGDKYKQYRLLRSTKNRFGPTDEVAILEMLKSGLSEVANPSKIFLAETKNHPGSVICPVAEGSQVFLVEVQALVAKTSFGYPKRSASGFDQKRLELLTTILTKRAGVNLANFDVYINIAGGLTLREPALDLAVSGSIISAYQEKIFPPGTAVFGELWARAREPCFQ